VLIVGQGEDGDGSQSSEKGRRRLGLAMMEWQLWAANGTPGEIGYNPSVLHLPITILT
jgi:hypothetical protein